MRKTVDGAKTVLGELRDLLREGVNPPSNSEGRRPEA